MMRNTQYTTRNTQYEMRNTKQTTHRDITEQSIPEKSKDADRIDLLRSRVELLKGKDKALMNMYLERDGTFREMARIAGVNEANIARRIHKLIQRLIDGEYITCLRNRKKFTGLEMFIARDYFLSGLSMRKIAAKRDCSYYQVRQCLKKIQWLVQIKKEETNGGGND